VLFVASKLKPFFTTRFSNTFHLFVPLLHCGTKFHTHTKTNKYTVLYASMFRCEYESRNDKCYELNDSKRFLNFMWSQFWNPRHSLLWLCLDEDQRRISTALRHRQAELTDRQHGAAQRKTPYHRVRPQKLYCEININLTTYNSTRES
jgi:hypothetical protein